MAGLANGGIIPFDPDRKPWFNHQSCPCYLTPIVFRESDRLREMASGIDVPVIAVEEMV